MEQRSHLKHVGPLRNALDRGAPAHFIESESELTCRGTQPSGMQFDQRNATPLGTHRLDEPIGATVVVVLFASCAANHQAILRPPASIVSSMASSSPIPSVKSRALSRHSSTSSSSFESATMPLPIPRTPCPSRTTEVRVATLKAASSLCIQPIAPQYTSRGLDSSLAICFIAEILGAAVTDPQGKSWRNRSGTPSPGRNRPSTS